MSYIIFYYIIMLCFQRQPPLFLKVSQIPQESTFVGVNFLKSCRPAGLFHVCFFLYPIVHVNYVKCYCLHKHFYGFLEIDLWKLRKKTHIEHIHICGSQTFWSFMKFYFLHIVKVCFLSLKNSHYAYIPMYMHKALPTLWNEKER